MYCISIILQENLPFLLELHLLNQNLSAASINILSAGLKSNHSLIKITLSSITMPDLSLFSKISEALTLNEVLKYINLSNNRLNNTNSDSLLELLGVLPYLAYLNLDSNDITEVNWGNIIAVNTSLEQLDFNYNYLTFNSVSNILESLMINRNLKVLSLLGYRESDGFAAKLGFLLANVFKSSNLQSLIIDIGPDYQGMNELASTLCDVNNFLIDFGHGDDWKQLNKFTNLIWRAIQANQWISFKLQDPTIDYEIETEFQEILESKLARLKDLEKSPNIKPQETKDHFSNIIIEPLLFHSYTSRDVLQLSDDIDGVEKAEEELIAQVYSSNQENVIPEAFEEKSLISNSIFNDSPRNLTYSDSSHSETPRTRFEKDEAKEKQENSEQTIKKLENIYQTSLENTKKEFHKEIQFLSDKLSDLQSQLVSQKNVNSRLQELFKETDKKSTAKEKSLQKFFASSEERLSRLEKLEDCRNQELTESQQEIFKLKESDKETNTKIDKLEMNMKLQLTSLKKSSCKKQEIQALQEKQASISSDIQSVSSTISSIENSIEKLKIATSALQKSEKLSQKKKEDYDAKIQELAQSLSALEAMPSLKHIESNLQKEFDAKINKIELKIWDTLDNDVNKELASNSFRLLEKKINLFEIKLMKQAESINEISLNHIKNQSLKIPDRLEKLENQILIVLNDKKSPGTVLEDPKTPQYGFTENSRSSSVVRPSYARRNNSLIRPQNLETTAPNPEKTLKKGSQANLEVDKLSSASNFREDKELMTIYDKQHNSKPEIYDFLPGEAESIVLSAIIDKANNANKSQKLTKPNSPNLKKTTSGYNFALSQTLSSKTLPCFKKLHTDETFPSLELQESLKLRGINL